MHILKGSERNSEFEPNENGSTQLTNKQGRAVDLLPYKNNYTQTLHKIYIFKAGLDYLKDNVIDFELKVATCRLIIW